MTIVTVATIIFAAFVGWLVGLVGERNAWAASVWVALAIGAALLVVTVGPGLFQ